MFKCTDCGQEFEIKPDYCDCGNDLFEEIVKNQAPQPSYAFTPRTQTTRKPVDLPSLIIFSICIVLSILSWIFIGRDNGKPEPPSTPHPPQKVVSIPSIDKLWKDTDIPPKNFEVKVVDVQPVPVQTKMVPATKTAQKPLPQPAPVVSKQPVIPTQPATPKTTAPAMTEQQKQEIIKKLTTSKTPAQPQKVQEPAPAPQPTVKQPEPPQIDYGAQKRELNAYKTALRNKLGNNINFAAVIGDGQCAITFKLDHSGNLTGRAFSVQSTNDSLNDAVYAAMLQNPTFKAPPEGYKNETLTLSVKIYGGQFEVSLR